MADSFLTHDSQLDPPDPNEKMLIIRRNDRRGVTTARKQWLKEVMRGIERERGDKEVYRMA
jgi:hypothetical protein